MPFIRYKIGDVTDRLSKPDSSEYLPFDWFRKIDGRIADYIKLPDGNVIHPINALGGTFLRKFQEIRKHRVIWDGAVLNFVLELSGTCDMEAIHNAIHENLSQYDVKFIITVKERLEPSAGGKFKYVEITGSGLP
jgi:phenylacetate-coenzyme A ligase PaaK-like adenylate-forming protein